MTTIATPARFKWSAAMPQPNDLSRSLVALDQNSTIIAVVELSQSSWLVGGVLPGIERQPRKKLEPSPERLLALLHRWRGQCTDSATRSRAGVRKASGEETAGGVSAGGGVRMARPLCGAPLPGCSGVIGAPNSQVTINILRLRARDGARLMSNNCILESGRFT
jgi:hypothetical protein